MGRRADELWRFTSKLWFGVGMHGRSMCGLGTVCPIDALQMKHRTGQRDGPSIYSEADSIRPASRNGGYS